MKTIFITIFEGVEGKNILRTPVLPTILSDPEIRVVLFTKNQKRVSYFEQDFKSWQILYEVIPNMTITGLDKFFSRLKFILLRTATTHLMRRLLLEKRKSYFLYYLCEGFNWFLARPFFIRLSRFFDYYLVRNKIFSPYFDKYKPDLVFLANLFDETEIHLLREAKKRGIKTVGLINSWDRASGRCVLRLLPQKLIVFNEVIKEELIKHHLVSPQDIFVSGIPHYDLHFKAPYLSRHDFFKKIGIAEDKKIIVYAPLGVEYSDEDWRVIDLLQHLNETGKLGSNSAILVRFPPNTFVDELELKKRPSLIYDYPGARFSKRRGIDWDMNNDQLRHLSDTLYYMSLLITYASSISIDAAVLGRPVININFEIVKHQLISQSPIIYYQKAHYKKALSTGGIRLVNSEQELIEWINKYLTNPWQDKEKRLALAKQQCQFLDGKSGQRIGDFILNFLKESN